MLCRHYSTATTDFSKGYVLFTTVPAKGTMPSRWFAQSETGPGAVLQLEKSWTVISACEEHISQYAKGQGNRHEPPASDATIRLVCEQTDGNILSDIRIYKQIPAAGTEAEPAAVRAKQARTCEPDELIALRALTNKGSKFTPRLLDSKSTTQDDSGVVPGGFLVYVAWEVVAGEQLGTQVEDENCAFWRLDPGQRDIVRQHFKNNFVQLCKWGYMPLHGELSHLVWDAKSSTLGVWRSNIAAWPPEPVSDALRESIEELVRRANEILKDVEEPSSHLSASAPGNSGATRETVIEIANAEDDGKKRKKK
ncbi:hypothetical protein AbraCBS73388_002043 [Aspergillus brasiliensis]|uniref:Uncharacterized protein n=1 Tax=Aspergillus brasiliensis TaxID=319629 RepID=A0A9W5Z0D2_9EURO|nr:hypothetical protein AbraCBS73388_002043 [Aspergillus brasiliensis]